MPSPAKLTFAAIAGAVAANGLAGKSVCLHSSLRSFGPVEGGAEAVLRGFVSEGCTLVVPAFHYAGIVRPPPEAARWPRNGCDESTLPPADAPTVVPYRADPECIVRDMGAIPAALLRQPGAVRGRHPICSLASLGPRAQELASRQTPMDVYAPYRALHAEGDAWLVLAGVGLTKATPVHFAEALTGRALFRLWAAMAGEGVCESTVGGCSDGFERLAGAVLAIERRITVGASLWRVFPLSPFLESVAEAIRREPTITACGRPGCLRCPDAVAGGPIVAEG